MSSSASTAAHSVTAQWVLRIAVAMEFAGHGAFALSGKADWVAFITVWGFDAEQARIIMPIVGGLDVVLAVVVLVKPVRAALLWMAFWGLFTAMLRPMVGLSLLDFVERGANWGAPLALLLLRGWPKRAAQWWR